MTSKKNTTVGVPRRILIAVDADGLSDHAVRVALDLARRFEARLEFVHAIGTPALDWEYVEDPRIATTHTSLMVRAREAITAHVRALLADAPQSGSLAEESIHVAVGRPAKVIVERAREWRADWIMLGALRRRGGVDFGGTARAVLARAPGAVWVQPEAAGPIRHMLVPVDLSAVSMRALDAACALAAPLDADIRVVSCFDPSRYLGATVAGYPELDVAFPLDEIRRDAESVFRKTMAAFDWRGAPHEIAFLEGRPAEQIQELARGADLIVMGTHGRVGLSAMLLGHVAYSVLKHGTKPVLAIRDSDSASIE